jgi:hypothetical protein
VRLCRAALVSTLLFSPTPARSEEERLKLSKDVIELKIENNQIKESGESAGFEQSNKILALEDEILNLKMRNEKLLAAKKEFEVCCASCILGWTPPHINPNHFSPYATCTIRSGATSWMPTRRTSPKSLWRSRQSFST